MGFSDRVCSVESRKTSSDNQAPVEMLDLTGLLGADQVFDATGDLGRQADLIGANCNKVGTESCCEVA